jgi:Mrr N-terminal domain
MSPTIRIDDDVFEELKKHAEPFVDTPNTVLRRLLNLGQAGTDAANGGEELELASVADATKAARPVERATRPRRRRARASRSPRAKTGSILHESAYELPMLEIISEHGGRAAAREVLDELETRLDGQLTDVDRQELSSGDVRWRNRAQFVRLRLVEQGDMVKDSPRGVWEISEQGTRRIAGEAA